ncbi:MAG: hypothetical protein K8R60_24605 [Burkholderiales bacterium]|nr:hypothetical protein [Burkholderiales bacterium]
MATITEAQRKWLEGLGVDTAAADGAPEKSAGRAGAGVPGAADEYDSPVVAKPAFDPLRPSPDQLRTMMQGIKEQDELNKKEAEQALVKMNKVLADVKAYVDAIPHDELARASYAKIITEVRKRFPEAANLSQWVKQTANKVPALKGKLPSAKAVMDIVQTTVKARGGEMGWALSTGKNLMTVNSDRLLAAYMSELPAGVSVQIAGGVVQLTLEGAALTVATPAGEVDASAGKGGTKVSLKNKDFTIQVSNDGWKEFDPELRGQWKKISEEATTALSLKADRDKVKLELEQKKKSGEEITADLTADFDKREAEFNLAWKKLQEKITVTAKATEDKITASVVYLKKDKNNKDAVKAGVDAEVDLKALQGTLKAYYATPTLEAVLKVTAAADKVSAKLELTAVKTGVVVTASFEKALDETKAAIEVMLNEGKTKIAAELKQKADDLTAKLKIVHETKDLKLAAELEKTLKEVRGSIEVAYTKGNTTVTGGGNVSSTGEAGGKVQIDIALKDGRTFKDTGDKLSFAANVSTKGYKFEVTFSMGEPVETASLQDLFADADRQIKELYKLAGDKGIRSIEDAQVLNAKMQEVMKPIKDAANKAKTLKKKSEIAASFGFSIEGDWPAGGKAAPPAAVFSVTLSF